MPDSDSGEEAQFTTDCATSGAESGVSANGGRKKQVSMQEMLRRTESRRGKRAVPGLPLAAGPSGARG